jgi:hypothetical protein
LVSAQEEQASKNRRIRVGICNEICAIVIAVEGLGWMTTKHEGKKRNEG